MAKLIMTIWGCLTEPRSEDENDVKVEYLVNVVLAFLSVGFFIVSLIFTLLVIFDIAHFGLEFPIASGLTCLFFMLGLWLSRRGYWQVSRYFPLTSMLLLGLYSAYFYGLGVVLIMEVTLATLFAAFLLGERIQWWILSIGVTILIVIGTIRLRFIDDPDLVYWFAISVTYFIVFLFLLVFLMRQFSRSLEQTYSRGVQLQVSEARVHQQLQRLSALHEIDIAIASSLELSQKLRVLIQQVVARLDVDAACVIVLDDTSGLNFTAGHGFNDADWVRKIRTRLEKGLAGRVVAEEGILHYPDLTAENLPVFTRDFALGEGFVLYYGLPLKVKGSLVGIMEIFHRSAFEPDDEWLGFLETLAGQAALALHNASLYNDLQFAKTEVETAYMDTLSGWAQLLDMRDEEVEGHTRRVTEMTVDLAKELGFTDEELIQVARGALLHDIGKMSVPDKILNKPGSLTEQEMEIMKQHPVHAQKFLSSISYLEPALDIPYCHHERWDGTGYPQGLKGENIPLSARIFAVVDVYDALCSDRPYRKAWPREKVLAYIQEQSNQHFDPHVVAAFQKMITGK